MNVVVELRFHGASITWGEYTVEEARELLAKKMNPGWVYTLPMWQCNEEEDPHKAFRQLWKRVTGKALIY